MRFGDQWAKGEWQVAKDHSEAVLANYRMCGALTPEWRQVDEAVGAIMSDFIVSEQLVPFVRQADDPRTDDLGRD